MLALVLVFSLFTGCSGNSSEKSEGSDDTIRVGWSELTMSVPYYKSMVDAASNAAKEQGMEFTYIDAQDDINKQVSDVEDLIAKGVDIILIDAKDPVAIVPAVKEAKEAGIPVFAVDSSMDESAPIVTTIQANNGDIGVAVGKWMAQQVEGTTMNTALISGVKGNIVGQERRQGFIAGVLMERAGMDEAAAWKRAVELDEELFAKGKFHDEASDFGIVGQGWGAWTNEGGLSTMEDLLTANSNVNVLFAENDAMALGAVKAIEAAGLTGKVIVGGVDSQKEALELIKDNTGVYHVTGLNSPEILGKLAIEMAGKYLKGEKNRQCYLHARTGCDN